MLTGAEERALALVRAGRSFDEASKSTNVPLERIVELWGRE